MPKGKGYGSKHKGKGVSRQMGVSKGGGRTRGGRSVSDPNGATAIASTDRSSGAKRYVQPGRNAKR